MSVTLDGSEGVWTRFGRAYKEYQRALASVGSDLNAGVLDLYEEYASGNDAIAVDGLYSLRDSFRTTPSSYLTGLVNVAQRTVIEQTNRDQPLAQRTLSAALTELIRQMRASSDSFNRPTVSASVTPYGSNYGDGTFVVGMTGPAGDPFDMCFAEDINLKCTTDVSAGVTEFRETYTITGEPALATTDYQWPGGSGATGTISMFDAASQNDLISNGGFDTWSNASAAPDSSWTSVLGTFGTNLTRSSSNKRGTYALAITSNGSALYGVKQQLSTSIVKPNQIIHFNSWMKVSSSDGDGILRIRLCDGAGTTLTNDASTSQAYSREMDGQIGTAYTNVSTTFQTPKVLPSTGVFVEIALTTSPANAVVVTVDLVGMKVGQSLYSGGPTIAAFSGATANALNDYSTLAVSNNATSNFFVKALDRFFSLRQLGLYFPTAGSETISDTLLTA